VARPGRFTRVPAWGKHLKNEGKADFHRRERRAADHATKVEADQVEEERRMEKDEILRRLRYAKTHADKVGKAMATGNEVFSSDVGVVQQEIDRIVEALAEEDSGD